MCKINSMNVANNLKYISTMIILQFCENNIIILNISLKTY